MPNMVIIGPTNNGKTMIVEKFRRNHLPYDSDDGTHEVIPVLMVQMPSDPTVSRFYSAIISALGSPVTRYQSTAVHEIMAIRLLRTTQTKILVVDELHNILSGQGYKQLEFLNLIRFIGNELQLSIVGVGIKDAYLAIRTDDQLENRFEPFILPLWRDDNEFTRLLASFKKVLPLRKPSELTDPDIRAIILELGVIATFLVQAACEAIGSEKECIDLAIL